MAYIDVYSKYLDSINKLEKEVRFYNHKIHSKNIFDLIYKPIYKEFYEKYSKLLFQSYNNLERIITEDEKELV